MRKAGSIALIALVAAVSACSEGAGCDAEFGPFQEINDDYTIGDIYEMPDLEMTIGETVKTPLADYYGPEECGRRYYHSEFMKATSADPSAVAVWISDARLVTAALDVADTVRVTVGLNNDWFFGTDSADVAYPPHEFLVRVLPRRVPGPGAPAIGQPLSQIHYAPAPRSRPYIEAPPGGMTRRGARKTHGRFPKRPPQ